MRAALVCLLIFCLEFFLLPAQAFEDGYLPLDKRILSHRFSQKLVVESLQAGQSVYWGKAKICISPLNYLTVKGSDNNSKQWNFTAAALSGSASVWTADLDNNGTQDLIFFAPTGGCGWAPSSDFIALLFEKDGRPFPWIVDGFFEVDSHGIKDLLDLNNDGRAELIKQNRDDGYWITSFYEARNARWHRLRDLAGITLPMHTRFTYSSNKNAISPPAYRHPFEPDFSNDSDSFCKSAKQRYIDEIEWANVSSSENPDILLSDGKHCIPAAWYATFTVVLDEPTGRRIAVLSAGEATHKLLQEICGRRLPVSVAGARTKLERSLSPELIFAQSRSAGNFIERKREPRAMDLAVRAQSSEIP